MTEYDFSPEAYERYMHTQNRVANWVSHTEQHRHVFEAAVPGAPGVLPAPRRQHSPLLPSHRPSPIYHHTPPSSSADSYVHVAAPQLRPQRPPPPPIYAPPIPPPYPSPVPVRRDHHSSSPNTSRSRHYRSKSHSHSYRSPPPPPLLTPIYTSPPASPFIPPPPIIYMASQGYPTPSNSRHVLSPRELYRKSSKPRTGYPPNQPPTPSETTSSSSDNPPPSPFPTSSPNSPTSFPFPPSPAPATQPGPSISGPGGSRLLSSFAAPWQEGQNQKLGQYQNHNQPHAHTSINVLPSLDPPYISRNILPNHSQRLNHQPRTCLHSYHDQSRRTTKSGSQSCSHPHCQSRYSPITLRPQPYARHSDPSYDKFYNLSTTAVNHDRVISVSVPPRHPVQDRQFEHPLKHTSSLPRSKQAVPLILHTPQPMRHSDMLNPRLSASPRA